MFTGLIESIGIVERLNPSPAGQRIRVSGAVGAELQLGESIAVNGCCLTVVVSEEGLRFDLSPETMVRTSLGDAVTGTSVNLERAMKPNDRFGGHIVQGHVDGTGTFVGAEVVGNSTVMTIQAPPHADRYLIDKGSITVDGISLTVVEPHNGMFTVWLIPQTLRETNLGERKPGDRVNLEFDVIAKYVERLVNTN